MGHLPDGPFMLSVQPGNGSFQAGVTIEGRTITSGRCPRSSRSRCSATALVKEYTFGHLPSNLKSIRSYMRQFKSNSLEIRFN